MKNNLRLTLQLIDIKDELIEIGKTDLAERLNEIIKDIEGLL